VYNTLSGANTTSSFPSSTPLSNNKPNPSKSSTKPKTQETKTQFHAPGIEELEQYKAPSPTTSFFLIYILTTALSLITAPLVEPRYFILPWVFLRLHLPTPNYPIKLMLKTNSSVQTGKQKQTRINIYLVMETAHHLLINLVTGYIFLYRGFSWPQEEGRVQRFMW
jgi:alpha-1,2-glucosyltransferase